MTNEENLLQYENPTEWISGHYFQESTNQEQAVTNIRNLTTTLNYPKILTYSWTFTPIPNWTWTCRDFSLCTDPSTWLTFLHESKYGLTPQQPFDCCSWFAAASHRNTKKIFNIGASDFACLQNPKVYKKRCNISFFCRRRLGCQKEKLMKLSRIKVFFLYVLI